MPKIRTAGQVITFYSFKGGVGRTMALANVAFLAACSGKRVLMMDWDLEAPGLEYYFRGLKSSSAGKKSERGILDVLWAWCSEIEAAQPAELVPLMAHYRNATPFQKCVRSVVEPGFIPRNAKLDFIGAGSADIATPSILPYGEALAKFSWSDFFENLAGGMVIDSLRNWAKSNYDLIFIDSRTGLADVAGLCTMQIPDQVALCFILNRQNIDGTAQVAATIKSKRGEDVKVRAVAMRVAGRETSEESDARARAITTLTRIGQMKRDQAEYDLEELAIRHSESVPFYEVLTPFSGAKANYDPLTLQYARLAEELTGSKPEIPNFDDDKIALVRDRIKPRTATISYIKDLRTAEPVRAEQELKGLLEGTRQAVADGIPLEPQYVQTLFDTVLELNDSLLEADSDSLQIILLSVARELYRYDTQQWGMALVEILEHYYVQNILAFNDQEELDALREIDEILGQSQGPAFVLRRLENLRRIAHAQSRLNLFEQLSNTLEEIDRSILRTDTNWKELNTKTDHDIICAVLDYCILKGDLLIKTKRASEATSFYKQGLQLCEFKPEDCDSEIRHQLSIIHSRLAIGLNSYLESVPEINDASSFHALQSIKWGGIFGPGTLSELSNVIFENASDDHLIAYAKELLDSNLRIRRMQWMRRTSGAVIGYLEVLYHLTSHLCDSSSEESKALLLSAAACTEELFVDAYRRSRNNAKSLDPLKEILGKFRVLFATVDIEWPKLPLTEYQSRNSSAHPDQR